MASQKCPKCKSDRVRMGYRPTSIFSKLIFRYHLLCDECNWEFTGFGIPGTVAKKTRKRKTNTSNVRNSNVENNKDLNLINEILDNKKKEQINETDSLKLSENSAAKKLEPPQVTITEKPNITVKNMSEESPVDVSNSSGKLKIRKRVKVKF